MLLHFICSRRVDTAGAAPRSRRVFVIGLAYDYCVLDSALNASSSGLFDGGSDEAPGVFMLVDATRAAHIPGLGTFGSGFLTDPASIVSACKASRVRLSSSRELLGPV